MPRQDKKGWDSHQVLQKIASKVYIQVIQLNSIQQNIMERVPRKLLTSKDLIIEYTLEMWSIVLQWQTNGQI